MLYPVHLFRNCKEILDFPLKLKMPDISLHMNLSSLTGYLILISTDKIDMDGTADFIFLIEI